MDWSKCTDRMPPDMEPVILTIENKGERHVYSCAARWNKSAQWWECLMYHEDVGKEWRSMYSFLKITHWMPYPEPAED